MNNIFFGFVCGIVVGVWVCWLVYTEQEKTIVQLHYALKEKNNIIGEKNTELINLYNYIIYLHKQPMKPAPKWAEYSK